MPWGRPSSERARNPRADAGLAESRGAAAGAISAGLAVAAHGLAGGGFPNSTALMLVCSVAAVVGAIAMTLPSLALATGRAGLLAALVAGQWAGHEALSGLIGHEHAAGGRLSSPAAAMFASSGHAMLFAHALAILLCALLLVVAERLYSVVSRAIRAVTDRPRPLSPPLAPARWPGSPVHVPRFLRLGAIAARAPPVPA
ncbi:hypothetical protein [Nocardia aurantia]|nr:hypothetical protein [Nocardia aurantia]